MNAGEGARRPILKLKGVPIMRSGRQLVGLPLVIALTASIILFPSASARATFPGTNGRIVFADYIANQIYSVNPDGTGLVQLTHVGDGKFAGWPDSSPDGEHVAFESNRSGNLRLWIMNADGTHLRMVAEDRDKVSQQVPAYTPDGTRLVYTRCVPRACAIYSVGVDGTDRRALTPFQRPPFEVFDLFPAVSPDGAWIAFTRFNQNVNGVIAQIYVMRADGSDVHAISAAALEGANPDWSPDGKRIAFTSACCGGRLGSNIYVMNADGTGSRGLTGETYPNNGIDPSYSPEGDRIAFASDRRYNDFCCQDLFVMKAGGADETLIPTGLSGVYDPSWGTLPPIASGSARTPTIRSVSSGQAKAGRAAWCKALLAPTVQPWCGGSG
jgi:TolB protein